MKEERPLNLAEKLKQTRQQQNLTQSEVANRLNVSRKTISSWETGRSLPNFDLVNQLADLYHIPTSQLISDGKQSNHDAKISYRTKLIRYKRWGYISKYAYYFDLVLILASLVILLTPFSLKNLWITPLLIIDLSIIFLYESHWKTITDNQPLMRKLMIVVPLIFLAVFATGYILNVYIYHNFALFHNPANLIGILILTLTMTASILIAIIFPLKRLTVK